MALQRMILVPAELWESRCQTPPPPPPVKKIIKTNDHSYNKLTQVRLHQDPYLKTEKQKRETIPIPIIETGSAEPSFKTKPKRKRIIGSVPLFIMEAESETDLSPMHSEYTQNVLRSKVSHDPTFGVYQDDTDGSFKIGRSSFKYNDKHVFVDGRKYKATQGLWELLTKPKPDKNAVIIQDRQAYKQILLQSNANRVNYSPTGKIKANKGLKYTRFISQLFTDKNEVPWESVQ